MSHVVTLPPEKDLLPDGSKPGGWWHQSEQPDRIVCDLCPRECTLKPGDRGFCFVRENRDGQMVLNTYGRSTGFCIDPIEKKPLNHFYPGTSVLSFGTAGCNLGCKFCQNWSISKSREVAQLSETATPEAIAAAAGHYGCHSVAFTYNDPVIWAEYAIDTARACHEVGIKTVAVTAGYITPVARGPFYEVMDAANVDLKGFSEDFYHKLTLSHLQPVLDTLRWLKHETDVWFEITNLIIPQANDSPDEMRRMCDWILDHVGDEVPVHFTAFHPDFRMRDRGHTPPETLLGARRIALETGLKYAYVGNVDDVKHQSTYCPACGKLLIERNWYDLGQYNIQGGRCNGCGHRIAGRFDHGRGDWGRRRMPVRISQFNLPLLDKEGPGEVPSRENAPRPAKTAPEETQTAPTTAKGTPSRIGSHASPGTDESSTPASAAHISHVQLDETAQTALHQAASQLVAAAVLRQRADLSDDRIGGLSDVLVDGCFVSLKRKNHLRGCCGFLGQRIPLSQALARAAHDAATGDVRLPCVSPAELPQLDLEVWLLHSLRRIDGPASERSRHVVIGRHGLQLIRGQSRGLLLPGVAVEAGFDAAAFLRQTCLKAGLPASAWEDEATQVITFDGHCTSQPLADHAFAAQLSADRPSWLTDGDLQRLAELARESILAYLRGSTPMVYAGDVPDGTVQGICLIVNCGGTTVSRHESRISLRPGIPLQAMLGQMAQAVAQQLAGRGDNIDDLEVALAIFDEAAMQGVVAEPDLAGFVSAQRALLVIERGRHAWAFDRDRGNSPQQLLQQALGTMQIAPRGGAHLYSLRTATTHARFSVSSEPQPLAGPAARPAAVAGRFYPGDGAALAASLDELFAGGENAKQATRAAAMVPHAGWTYSGRIAARTLAGIKFPSTVLLIGPKHTPHGAEWAVAPHETWSLPGGDLPSDPALARQLADAIDGLQLDAAAHQREHGIEVELPLIARLAPATRVVGLVIGAGDLPSCQQFAAGLASVLQDRDDVLPIISSDMNHFATDEENRRLDEMAIRALETLDPAELYRIVRGNHISMCGLLPAVIIIETLRRLGRLRRAERVAYGTSADTSGDTSRVVGYAGMWFE